MTRAHPVWLLVAALASGGLLLPAGEGPALLQQGAADGLDGAVGAVGQRGGDVGEVGEEDGAPGAVVLEVELPAARVGDADRLAEGGQDPGGEERPVVRPEGLVGQLPEGVVAVEDAVVGRADLEYLQLTDSNEYVTDLHVTGNRVDIAVVGEKTPKVPRFSDVYSCGF